MPANAIVDESDDGCALFRKAAGALGSAKTVGVGARTWGEAVIEDVVVCAESGGRILNTLSPDMPIRRPA